MEKIKRNIFYSLAGAALLYLAFAVYADYNSVINSFGRFNWLWLPVLCMLAFFNYLFRFFKWDYYLRLLEIKINRYDSFAIFMSGLIMSVTPGKMGELMKAYLVKKITGDPISKTAPIIFAERVTDFISLVMLAIVGAYVFDFGRTIVLGVGIFFIALTFIITNKRLSEGIIGIIMKIRLFEKHAVKILQAYESSYTMLKMTPLVKMVFLSLVAWSFECFAYYLILINFNIETNILFPTFVYTFSTIAGAITMLPGGLGVTEGSLTFLLKQAKISTEIAVSSTIIIRTVTLWFAVLVGIISVTLYQKRFGKITETYLNNN